MRNSLVQATQCCDLVALSIGGPPEHIADNARCIGDGGRVRKTQCAERRSPHDRIGKRYDQLLGGDGNNIADLRNLMTDTFYARLFRQKLLFFDNGSFTFSYNGQREERINQCGQGNPAGAITNQR